MKLIYSDKHLRGWLHEIIRGLAADNWRPDYIVGITRGGLIPATMLSHYLNIPMHTLDISFRDADDSMGPESNLWMAEDAFGYIEQSVSLVSLDHERTDPALRKNILIVDDINDSGRTLQYIQQDWPSGCLPDNPAWQEVWGNNVRMAVMINNQSSNFKDVDYMGAEINKLETPCWVVFPWEQWWEN